MSGTSGGITSNGYCCFGILDSARWPIILDLLEEAGVTWKIYNRGGLEDVLGSDVDNVAWLWSRWAHDPRTSGTYDEYLRDCAVGTLPAVSWLIPSYTRHLDEHPPNDVSAGMRLQQQAIGALRASPLWVISPLLRRRGVVATRRPPEHVSTLKLIERVHGLPALASRNHAFDRATPTGPGHDTYGAPAPPRDGLSAISDLTELFALDRREGTSAAGTESRRPTRRPARTRSSTARPGRS